MHNKITERKSIIFWLTENFALKLACKFRISTAIGLSGGLSCHHEASRQVVLIRPFKYFFYLKLIILRSKVNVKGVVLRIGNRGAVVNWWIKTVENLGAAAVKFAQVDDRFVKVAFFFDLSVSNEAKHKSWEWHEHRDKYLIYFHQSTADRVFLFCDAENGFGVH